MLTIFQFVSNFLVRNWTHTTTQVIFTTGKLGDHADNRVSNKPHKLQTYSEGETSDVVTGICSRFFHNSNIIVKILHFYIYSMKTFDLYFVIYVLFLLVHSINSIRSSRIVSKLRQTCNNGFLKWEVENI